MRTSVVTMSEFFGASVAAIPSWKAGIVLLP